MIRPIQTDEEGDSMEDISPAEIAQRGSDLAVNTPPPEPTESPSVLMDVLTAPFRGAEDAARNVFHLADFVVPEAATVWTENATGTSETTAGKIVENVANFLTAFIPVAGVAGKVAQGVGLAGKAARIAAVTTAGAATDFAAFSGREERLSNLIQSNPSLANPISEYLAANPDDTELEGRLKNAIEGLGLGVLTDGLLAGLKAVRISRSAKAGAATAEDVAKATAEAEAKAGDSLGKLRPAEALESPAIRASDAEVADILAAPDFDPSSVGGRGIFQIEKGASMSARLDVPEDAMSLWKATANKLIENAKAAGTYGKVETRPMFEAEVSKRLGYFSGLTGEEVQTVLKVKQGALQDAYYYGEAAARQMAGLAYEASEYAKLVASGKPLTGLTMDQTILKALKAQQLLAGMMESTRVFGVLEGRALQSRRYIKTLEIEAADTASQLVEQFGGTPFLSKELEKMAFAPNLPALVRKQTTLSGRLLRAHNEYWLNALLSGPKTTVANVMGNTFTSVVLPLEQAIGGVFQQDSKAVMSAMQNYVYLAEAFSDASRGFLRTIREGDNILLNSSPLDRMGQQPSIAVSAANPNALVQREATGLWHLVNWVGSTVRMPSRFLMAQDEFFKQINYRAAAKAKLYYNGVSNGLRGDELAAYIDNGFGSLITKGGRMYSEDAVIREAYEQAAAKNLKGIERIQFVRQYKQEHWDATKSALKDFTDVSEFAKGVAEEATFTRPLGDLGKGVQRFANSHPVAQLLLPFVRTPTNIVKWFGDRALGLQAVTPGLDRIQTRNVQELLSSDSVVASKAAGRIAAGQMLVTLSAFAALSGKVTGRGPSDKNEQAILRQTGWQPYSFVVGDGPDKQYISFQRLDPLATFFGMVADWADVAKRQDPQHASGLDAVLKGMVTAVSNNVTNKTYLAGLSQVVSALSDPDRYWSTLARARVSSYVPGLLAQVNTSMTDGDNDSMREVRRIYDGAFVRAGLGDGLPVKRNVLGEPVDSITADTSASWINPLVRSKAKNDPVFEELARFNHGIQPPSPIVRDRINLLNYKAQDGTLAYDRFQQLVGEVGVGGKSLRAALERLISSASYQKLALTEPADGIESPRLGAVNRIVERYRRAALVQLQREFPKIKEDMQTNLRAKADLRRGERTKALEELKKITG